MAGIFSAVVAIGMLAMPVRALAHDWDHDGDGWRHVHRDHGRHLGWYKHHDDDDDYGYGRRGYYQPRYGYNQEPDADDFGPAYNPYGNNFRFRTGRQMLPSNGNGMVSARNPSAVWTCDGDGHHCHWQHRRLMTYPGYNNNGYYNNGYYNGYGGYSPLYGLGSLLGIR